MKYMLCWSIAPENYDKALDAFLAGGAPMPAGLTSLGRWHSAGSTRGWLLCETDGFLVLSQHAAQWAGLLNIKIHPITDDAGAADAAVRARA